MMLQLPEEVRQRAVAAGITTYTAANGESYLVVHHMDTWLVYANVCPHRRLRLDRGGQLYLTPDRSLVVCVHHGARFQLLTGKCVAGPCVGRYLQRVPEWEASS
jgi:nitrite reductase/ring-hydroxylating ferredoxin subunit